MTEVEKCLKWKLTHDPTPPKPNKTYNKFFGGGVIKNTKHCLKWPLFGTRQKMVIMMFAAILFLGTISYQGNALFLVHLEND